MSKVYSQELAVQICSLARSSLTVMAIAQKLKLPTPIVSRMLLFLHVHGEQAFVDYWVKGERLNYTSEDYANIIEYRLVHGLSIERTMVLFKASRKLIVEYDSKRQQLGHPLNAHAHAIKAVIPRGARIDDIATWRQSHLSAARRANATTTNASAMPAMVAGQPRLGRATTPIPRYPRSKPRTANSKLGAPTKPDQLSALSPAASATTLAARTPLTQSTATSQDNSSLATPVPDAKNALLSKNQAVAKKAQPLANKVFLKDLIGHYAKGAVAANISSLTGRPTRIDPFSKGFEDLPFNIRRRAIQEHKTLQQMTSSALRLARNKSAVGTKELQEKQYQLFEKLTERYPDSPISPLLEVIGMPRYAYERIYKNKHAVDKYKEVKILIQQIAQESNYTFGKVRISMALRQHGYYFCLPTVSRLMKEAGVAVIGNYGKKDKASSSDAMSAMSADTLVPADITTNTLAAQKSADLAATSSAASRKASSNQTATDHTGTRITSARIATGTSTIGPTISGAASSRTSVLHKGSIHLTTDSVIASKVSPDTAKLAEDTVTKAASAAKAATESKTLAGAKSAPTSKATKAGATAKASLATKAAKVAKAAKTAKTTSAPTSAPTTVKKATAIKSPVSAQKASTKAKNTRASMRISTRTSTRAVTTGTATSQIVSPATRSSRAKDSASRKTLSPTQAKIKKSS